MSRKSHHKPTPTLAQILPAIPGSYGIIGELARRTGYTRAQIEECIATKPVVKKAVEEERLNGKDAVLLILARQAEDGSVQSAKLFFDKMDAQDGIQAPSQRIELVVPPDAHEWDDDQ